MSVFNSFGPLTTTCKKYPTYYTSSTMEDHEPGRCRRTDGRKWRCSKNVIPDQKYCERHMHRGRHQGSRKPVETIQCVPEPNYKPSTVDNTTTIPTVSLVTSDKRFSIALAPNQPMNNGPTNLVTHTKDKDTGFIKLNSENLSGRTRGVGNNDVRFISLQIGSSPNSVLNRGSDKIELGLGNKNDIVEPQAQRCRRTDGKRWRCKRDPIPNEKYCERHMHRGRKRHMLNSESISNDLITLTSDRAAQISHTMARNSINLNSMPASPQHISGCNSSSSTSDATTISDENISISLA